MQIETKRKVFLFVWAIISVGTIQEVISSLMETKLYLPESTDSYVQFIGAIYPALLGLELTFGLATMISIYLLYKNDIKAVFIFRRLCELSFIYIVITIFFEPLYFSKIFPGSLREYMIEHVVFLAIAGLLLYRMREEVIELFSSTDIYNES
jgi:hypothetical protein